MILRIISNDNIHCIILYIILFLSVYRIRNVTWTRLLSLKSQGLSRTLDKLLHSDPIYPILTQAHLDAIDRRHHTLINVINECIKELGASSVIINEIL